LRRGGQVRDGAEPDVRDGRGRRRRRPDRPRGRHLPRRDRSPEHLALNARVERLLPPGRAGGIMAAVDVGGGGALAGVFPQSGRFEDGAGIESKPWLGGVPGLVLGLVVTLGAAASTPLACGAVFAAEGSGLVGKLVGLVWMVIVAATMA